MLSWTQRCTGGVCLKKNEDGFDIGQILQLFEIHANFVTLANFMAVVRMAISLLSIEDSASRLEAFFSNHFFGGNQGHVL
jgi:hypothetical protein